MAKISINLATGTLQKPELIVGIDLGTANSLVAFIDPDQQPKVINDTGKGLLLPSILHFTAAGKAIVGNEAKNFLISDPVNTVFSVKRLLGRAYGDIKDKHTLSYQLLEEDNDSLVKIQLGNKLYTPIELSAEFLKELRKRAEHALKTPVNRAVIAVPAYFNDRQRQATREAGKLAGLEVMNLVNEAAAACLAYGIGLDPAEQKTIAVYDLGAGTFDITILTIKNGVFEILSTAGNTFLGGDDFDKAIVQYWIDNNKLDSNTVQADGSLMQQLRLKAEEAKKALDSQNLFNETVGEIWCTIDRQTFEGLISGLTAETLNLSRQALADAKLESQDIDELLMVGGTSKIPSVKTQVAGLFGREPNAELNPDEAVALGAAIQADMLAGNRTGVLLKDITPFNMGVVTEDGFIDVIFPKLTSVPAIAERQYTTLVDGQSGINFSVYQGESLLAKENRKLAEFELKGIPLLPAGKARVHVTFNLDQNGILDVLAIEPGSGVSQEIVTRPSYSRGETISNIEGADAIHQKLMEARGEGSQLVQTAERFVEGNTFLLSSIEIAATREQIAILKHALETGDRENIFQMIAKLDEITRPYAKRIMDMAIAQAKKKKA